MSSLLQSSVFAKKTLPANQASFFAKLSAAFRSAGAIGYYMNSDTWKTRVTIYNYFSLMNDAPVSARWQLTCYSRMGKKVSVHNDQFTGNESVVIELTDSEGLDEYGITEVHVFFHDKEYIPSDTYSSLFFTEYYIPHTTTHGIAHSLSGALRASHYIYTHTGTSFLTPKGFRPYLFVGNGCGYQPLFHGMCGTGTVTFVNTKKQKLTLSIPPTLPRGCEKIDLFSTLPALALHVGTEPYSITVEGNNLLAIPFLFQTNGTTVLMEHI